MKKLMISNICHLIDEILTHLPTLPDNQFTNLQHIKCKIELKIDNFIFRPPLALVLNLFATID